MRLSAEEINAALAEIGCEPLNEKAAGPWPVSGLIHPGTTCINGPSETGKTTLATSLCLALLEGSEWLDEPTTFARDKTVVYLSESHASGVKMPQHPRLIVGKLNRLAGNLGEFAAKCNAGLIVIDSVYAAVPNENDQDQVSTFLKAVESATVPVVIVHHQPGNGARKPAGSNRFAAAYRQTIRVKKTGASHSAMRMHLTVSGNDVEDRELTAVVDRTTYAASRTADGPARRAAPKATPAEKAALLGELARDRALRTDQTANWYADRLVGKDTDPDEIGRQAVRAKLGNPRTGVSHKSIADLIRHERAAFDGKLSGNAAA